MMERWIRWIARWKWLVIGLWTITVLGSLVFSPQLSAIISHSETTFVPEDVQSAQALVYLNQINPEQVSKSNAILVMQRTGGLTTSDRAWLQGKIAFFKENQKQLGISGVRSAYDDAHVVDKFMSKDSTTELVILQFPTSAEQAVTQQGVKMIKQQFIDVPASATIELTGTAPIFTDYTGASNAGVKKTELITVLLVIGILLLVFRSPVAPLVSLMTIGCSLIVSRSAVAIAAQWGMPVSSFTEAFLIAILFGAGTDYCILVLHRFREQLQYNSNHLESLVDTMKTVGRTVLYAGSTVFIAFFLIGFAVFGLYQSAVGVAIGIVITLFATYTFTPALMLVCGKYLFWPWKNSTKQHHPQGIWGKLTNFTNKRPLLVIMCVLIVFSPFLFLFEGKRSFDDLAEIDPTLSAVKGFRIIEEKFGQGEVMPLLVAIASNDSMRTPEKLAALERASQAVSQLANVREVRSATRPLGQPIPELTVPFQLQQTNTGLSGIEQGLEHIRMNLTQASANLTSSQPAIAQLEPGAVQVSTKLQEVQTRLMQVSSRIQDTAKGLELLKQSTFSLTQTARSLDQDLKNLQLQFPMLSNQADFQRILSKMTGLQSALVQTDAGLAPLHLALTQLGAASTQLANGTSELAKAQNQISSSIGKMTDNILQLTDGLDQTTQALSQAVTGLNQINHVQMQMIQPSSMQTTTLSIPPSLLENPQYSQALDYYIAKEGKTTKFEVILDINPYSVAAMHRIEEIKETIVNSLKSSAFQTTDVKIAGTTAHYNDLDRISQKDFFQTGGLMLIGIFIVLGLLLRSWLMPIIILLSLGFNYWITMGILEYAFVHLWGYEGLPWSVSFFVFLILVALGVDYSIFLMARFKEEYETTPIRIAIANASKSTGGLIISAACIMGGTFAAFVFSGVYTLILIGAGVVIGLALYASIFIRFVIPAIVSIGGDALWWPFAKKNEQAPNE